MSLIDDSHLKEAIHSTIAKQILDGLDSTHRDELLQKSITAVVKDYGFRSAIDHVASDKAAAVATELMASEEWTLRIEQAVRDGFEGFLVQLREAVPEALKKTFHGSRGNYGHFGSILSCWPKVSKDSKSSE